MSDAHELVSYRFGFSEPFCIGKISLSYRKELIQLQQHLRDPRIQKIPPFNRRQAYRKGKGNHRTSVRHENRSLNVGQILKFRRLKRRFDPSGKRLSTLVARSGTIPGRRALESTQLPLRGDCRRGANEKARNSQLIPAGRC